MQGLATVVSVLAGLLFSLACALVAEELLFGGLVRLFFAPQPAVQKHNSGRKN